MGLRRTYNRNGQRHLTQVNVVSVNKGFFLTLHGKQKQASMQHHLAATPSHWMGCKSQITGWLEQRGFPLPAVRGLLQN